MGWDYRSYLGDEVFRELNYMKAFHPEYIEEETADRKPVGFPHEKIVFAAADHNARMINEYKGNPIGLSNRREYITRLFRELQGRRQIAGDPAESGICRAGIRHDRSCSGGAG